MRPRAFLPRPVIEDLASPRRPPQRTAVAVPGPTRRSLLGRNTKGHGVFDREKVTNLRPIGGAEALDGAIGDTNLSPPVRGKPDSPDRSAAVASYEVSNGPPVTMRRHGGPR